MEATVSVLDWIPYITTTHKSTNRLAKQTRATDFSMHKIVHLYTLMERVPRCSGGQPQLREPEHHGTKKSHSKKKKKRMS